MTTSWPRRRAYAGAYGQCGTGLAPDFSCRVRAGITSRSSLYERGFPCPSGCLTMRLKHASCARPPSHSSPAEYVQLMGCCVRGCGNLFNFRATAAPVSSLRRRHVLELLRQ